jgi:hypothetical protein
MIFSENRCPLFRIMLCAPHHTKIAVVWRVPMGNGNPRKT